MQHCHGAFRKPVFQKILDAAASTGDTDPATGKGKKKSSNPGAYLATAFNTGFCLDEVSGKDGKIQYKLITDHSLVFFIFVFLIIIF